VQPSGLVVLDGQIECSLDGGWGHRRARF
jgi:hypothetical protein